MTPKDGPRDWDKELAEVDKLIAGLQNEPAAPAGQPAPGGTTTRKAVPGAATELATRRASQGRRDLLAAWLWFVLAIILGVALAFFWPYQRDCGMPLYGYLGAVTVFAAASTCSIIWSWRMRMAVVHGLSIVLLFGSALLGAREVLPRIGYAKQAASWQCAVARPAPPPPAPVGSAKIDSVPARVAPPAAPGQALPAPTAAPTAPPAAAPTAPPAAATQPGTTKRP